MGRIYVGIGGWNYAPWRGIFYPEKWPQAKELEYAGERLTAIEINATHYKLQKPELFARWAKAVPERFKFAVKGSRYCTNRKALAEGGEGVARFCSQGLVELGDKLGPILWQFMPTKRFDPDDMAAFVDLLPGSEAGVKLSHALEVRHESFRDPAFFELARKKGAAIVFADSARYPEIDERTADFAYARLQRTRDEEPAGYDETALDRWAARGRDWATAGDAYVFMISGAKVRNPAAAQAMIARLG
jgi:uncharacterized protein YecE (DUF72 family)